MKKILRTFEVILPLMIASIAALLAVSYVGIQNTNGDLEQGLAAVFSVIFGSIPAVVLGALDIVLLVIAVFVILMKNKRGSLIAALVFLCLLLPVLLVYTVIAVTLISKVYVTLLAVLSIALYAVSFVLDCILVKNYLNLFSAEEKTI